jgi:hypothetical protein
LEEEKTFLADLSNFGPADYIVKAGQLACPEHS